MYDCLAAVSPAYYENVYGRSRKDRCVLVFAGSFFCGSSSGRLSGGVVDRSCKLSDIVPKKGSGEQCGEKKE